MKTRPRLKYPLALLAFLSIALIAAACFGGQRGLPPVEDILNFGRVNDHLYRGAQPDELGIKNLKHLGVTLVINLRTTKEASKAESDQAAASGILYTNVPLAGMGRPTDAQVAKILSLIETAPGPVFVHCEHGCDRTGTIIACYRIKHDHWTGASALQEAGEYGMSKLEHGMRKYIMDYARSNSKPSPPFPSAR